MKKGLYILFLSVFLFGVGNLYSQLNRANKYFDNYRYADAISLYAKVLKDDSNNMEALQNIAQSYKKLNQYTEAENYFKKADETGELNDESLLYYGQVLKNNDKLDKAKEQFAKFVKANPESLIGKLMLQSVEDIRKWKVEPPRYEVVPLNNLNSPENEFCAVPHDKGIVFVTDRQEDLVNNSKYVYNNKPYLSIFYAKEVSENNFDKAGEFSTKLNSKYHDGPVSFDLKNNKVYFTRVNKKERGADYLNKLKIYHGDLIEGKVKNIRAFEYNNDQHSVAHPWVSPDGKKLFFSSDMNGGKGGMDIYVCEIKEDGSWKKPINLGEDVNTPGDEVFPFYNKKGELYFSSNGHPGYGGLDVFMTSEEKLFKDPINLKSPLNSPKDDFGMAFKDEKTGYFSSNREEGIGGDDIYGFKQLKVEPKEETQISGVFEYNKLPADGVSLSLMNEDDEEVAQTTTDENGNFKFKKLGADENYMVVVNAEDGDIPSDAKLYLTNKDGEKVLLANKLGKGKFKFQALPVDEYDELPILEEEDEGLLTVSVFGQIYEKLPGDYSEGVEVYVVNDDGEIVGTATTDEDGKFEFSKLPPDEKYTFKVNAEDEANVIIMTEDGKVIESADKLKDGTFVYKRLSPDENMITLINEEDEVIKIAEDENFVISNIYYEYDKWDINEDAARELDKLILILKKNKHIRVELSSHTDSRASDKYNMELSQQRADAAKDYVVSKGIKGKRITAKGYGESKLVNHCSNNVECSEMEHSKNRRTEFKIIKK